ncbi:peptidoglycan DD-metalloendopeptidase family protein [Breznakiellaceae bacterium SP9]
MKPSILSKLTLAICAVFVIACLYSMDWPVDSGELIHNFGWNTAGVPLLGVSFHAAGPIYAAEGGEVFFRDDGSRNASRLPPSLGAWVALDHGDGHITLYCRYDEASEEPPTFVMKGDTIAQSGVSGWSDSSGLYFSLFDRRERRWVNPAMIISNLPDTVSPVIRSVMLEDTEGRLINPYVTRNIAQGRYKILVEAQDTLMPGGSVLAPNQILCLVNGSEIGVLNFETFSARDGVLMVYRNGMVPISQVYGPVPRYEIGETRFTRGQINMVISARDKRGNFQNVDYRLTIE